MSVNIPVLSALLRGLLAGAALAALSAAAVAGPLVVIVSAKSPAAALLPGQVAEIYLGQAARFPDGREAAPLDYPLGAPERDEFYRRVTGKSPALLKAYWTKMIFTGRGQPPREVRDTAALRRLVADNPGLIAYIDKAALDGSVQVVLELE